MSQEKQQVKKKRKKKVSQAQTMSARRRVDRARRERRRAKQKRKREEQRTFKFRVKVVRTYRNLKKQIPEKEAIKVVLEKYGPTEDWHFKLSASTVRRWNRVVGADNNYGPCRQNQLGLKPFIIRCRPWWWRLFSPCVTNWAGVDIG